MMNFIAYADGTQDLISIADIIGVYAGTLIPMAQQLKNNNLIKTNTN